MTRSAGSTTSARNLSGTTPPRKLTQVRATLRAEKAYVGWPPHEPVSRLYFEAISEPANGGMRTLTSQSQPVRGACGRRKGDRTAPRGAPRLSNAQGILIRPHVPEAAGSLGRVARRALGAHRNGKRRHPLCGHRDRNRSANFAYEFRASPVNTRHEAEGREEGCSSSNPRRLRSAVMPQRAHWPGRRNRPSGSSDAGKKRLSAPP